jgi:predicted ATPase/signal transduction histidine kinase/DNA-binding NarL/FixJ family response regulator/tRNA A-37 threonylcarbamoyl transferase component Bud32
VNERIIWQPIGAFMISLENIAVQSKIYESANSLVYRGIKKDSGTSVILKVLKQDYPTPVEITRYKQEYEITRSLNVKGIIKAYKLQEYQRTLVIILEDFGGESLDKLIQQPQGGYSPMPVKKFLSIAIKITEIIGDIHAANIIHKDINPGNIVLNPESGIVKIIDFGISTKFSRTNPSFKHPNVLEGSLAYMSPEQTGRMNRFLDYRSDFYSLGVTFYELLTGQLPYVTTDVLELVHCHIAKQPVFPHEVNTEIPPIISSIIMKLMAKNAEERYQSVWGIKTDLEECVTQLEILGKKSGTILEFPLGSKDISDKFQIPQKLYGRETEVQTLLAAFERVATEKFGIASSPFPITYSPLPNNREFMLVSGYAGIGKTVLVQEIYKPIIQKQGYFISGKFNHFQRDIPYSAVVYAFVGLVRQLLTETEAYLHQWREKILAALGNNAQIIIDVIPEVELIVGKQPPVPELRGTESQNRFNRVFQNFIRVFCEKEHPLVIFLDDLQWVDSATLKLIELMMTDRDTQYLFLIGAYRDSEVNSTHPLMTTLEKLTEDGIRINHITLAPLKLEPINQLIAETLHNNTASVKALSKLVLRKTLGNPFFVNEFLRTLHAENLLVFNFEHHIWEWDIAHIEAKGITDNVVDLMIDKVKKLPDSIQKIIRVAACIGANFDLKTLAIICEESPINIYFDLVKASDFGLIMPISELDEQLLIQDYKFLHDRVQQAAYALIDESQKQALNLQIGRKWLQETTSETIIEKLFEIVDHLNYSIKAVTDQEERLKIARLNLMAGKKAKAATAYNAAFKYLITGIKFLTTDSWQYQYNLTLALHQEIVEVSYLCGDFDAMERWTNVVQKEAKNILDQVKIYEIKIQTCVAQTRQIEAIETGLQMLELLGVHLPKSPTQLDVHQQLEETKASFQEKNIEDLSNRPLMVDAKKIAAMRILSSIAASAYIAIPTLFPLIVCEQVNLSLKYGNSLFSGFGYALYGIVLNRVVNDRDWAYQLGQLALNIVEKFNAKELECKTTFQVAGLALIHGKYHLKEILQLFRKTYHSGIENGDFEYASYAALQICQISFFCGQELTELEGEMAFYNRAIASLNQEATLKWNQISQQLVSNLLGHSENYLSLQGEAYDEEKSLPLHLAANDIFGLYYFYLHKLILCYLFGDFSEASKNSFCTEQYLEGAVGHLSVSLFYFFDSLLKLELYSHISNKTDSKQAEQEKLLSRVVKNQKHMQKLVEIFPINFQHKYNLVEAEKARVLGQFFEAEEFYEQAIQEARNNEFIQEEALAYELAAKFYLGRGREKFAQTYMREAHYCYGRWGAKAKVADLSVKYPQLITQLPRAIRTIDINQKKPITTTANNSTEALDLAAVMKASQAISGEIVLEKLLCSLMKILIENAGAEKGFLILQKSREWVIQASGEVASNTSENRRESKREKISNTEVLKSIPLKNNLPVSIISYVVRTKETIVLNDASCDNSFIKEPYFQQNKSKSVLCTPLINQGKLIGILYLENNLTIGAFTPEHSHVLNLLSSQAAISIENANLYNQLEDYSRMLELRVEQRTAELAEATDKAQAANKAKSTFLAKMSHELRTPLNAILGFSQLMSRSPHIPLEHKENLNIISRSGEHLLTLINQVLDLSKIEAGRTTLNETFFDLHCFLNNLKDMFQLKADNKKLYLLFEGISDIPKYVQTDEVKLRQVLINLLSNAIKFTRKGTVSVRTYSKQLSSFLDTKTRATNLYFEVEDTGIGIAADELGKLFEAFVQTKTGQQSQEGTGLGLVIARSFVQLMGGEITVSSELGRGTIFKFNIPVNIPVNSAVEQVKIKTNQPTQRVIALEPNQLSYRILVVDDNYDNCQLIIKLLSPLGFEVQQANNGLIAIAIWEEWQPHLIFMDMRMPVMDGMEATRSIRANQKNQDTVIIALTASVLENNQSHILAAGCNNFIYKPFREEDILEALHFHLGVRFIYEGLATTQSTNPTDALTSDAIATLPPDLIAKLHVCILNLDVELIQTCIAQISDLNEPLAQALTVMVNDFRYEQLLDLTQPWANKNE